LFEHLKGFLLPPFLGKAGAAQRVDHSHEPDTIDAARCKAQPGRRVLPVIVWATSGRLCNNARRGVIGAVLRGLREISFVEGRNVAMPRGMRSRWKNIRLYRDLAEREAKFRRLIDSNIVGIFVWELEGRIIEANDAFLHMVGYDRQDLVLGRLRWTDLTPSE
jgi:PAS domain-containing protein